MRIRERIRQRREAGVNIASITLAVEAVTNDPGYDPEMSRRELAKLVLEEIQGKQLPQLKNDEPGIDWEAIARFIERILPLILALFGF